MSLGARGSLRSLKLCYCLCMCTCIIYIIPVCDRWVTCIVWARHIRFSNQRQVWSSALFTYFHGFVS